jgi:hypothetical protein
MGIWEEVGGITAMRVMDEMETRQKVLVSYVCGMEIYY